MRALIGRESDLGIVPGDDAMPRLSPDMASRWRRQADARRDRASQPGRMANNPRLASEADNASNTVLREGRGRRPMTRASLVSVPILATAFLAGIAEGAVAYSRRSPILERQVPGTNAITVHVVLAIAAAAVVVVIQVWRARNQAQRAPSPWTAPFSSRAMARLTRTMRRAGGGTIMRAVPMALLVLVLLYAPYRMGAQVIGGLDPNSTVNAWGGPTYAGALLAHWLDCTIGFYVAAFLLGRLLVRGQDCPP
jgi:hypothetical protein